MLPIPADIHANADTDANVDTDADADCRLQIQMQMQINLHRYKQARHNLIKVVAVVVLILSGCHWAQLHHGVAATVDVDVAVGAVFDYWAVWLFLNSDEPVTKVAKKKRV